MSLVFCCNVVNTVEQEVDEEDKDKEEEREAFAVALLEEELLVAYLDGLNSS